MLSHVQVFATPWNAACQVSLSFTISWSLLKFISIELMMPSTHFILCQPLLFLFLIFPSIRVFSNESAFPIRWPNYWSFSFSISPSNEYSGLISFRIDWLYLLAVQGTLKSLLQHHSSKASILQCSAFLMVQLSPVYEKPYLWLYPSLWAKWCPCSLICCLKFFIGFLPRSKCLNFMAAVTIVVISEPKKIKSVILSIVSPSIYHEVMGLDAMIFIFWMLSFKPAFSLSLSASSRGSLVPLHFLTSGWCHLHIWGYWYFSQQSWFQLELHPVWHFTWYTLHIS